MIYYMPYQLQKEFLWHRVFTPGIMYAALRIYIREHRTVNMTLAMLSVLMSLLLVIRPGMR